MPVSPNAIPPTGPVSIAMLNAEFGLGNNLNAYKGIRMYNTANNSRRDIGTGSNAYVPMGDFRGYQATSPVVPGSRTYLTTQTDPALPLFNIMTVTVWGAGGGGGGGAVTNNIWGKAADGNPGAGGNSSSVVVGGTTLSSASGGGGGGGGLRGSNASAGSNGSGYDTAHGVGGNGGAGYNGGNAGDARAGGKGGYGGKSAPVFNVDANSSYLNMQGQPATINIGSGGTGGSGGYIDTVIQGIPFNQSGSPGSSGDPGYVVISWT